MVRLKAKTKLKNNIPFVSFNSNMVRLKVIL